MNDAIRSPRFALKSFLRGLSGTVCLVVILMNSGCVGTTSKTTNPSTGGASIELSSTSLSFGNLAIGQSATQQVTLTNSGTEMLTVSAITVSGTGFTASGPHLPLSLSAGQSASISAVFKPTVGSAETGAITIASNAATSPSMVALSGAGITAAGLTATPASIAFGNVAVGSTATQTVKLSNTGTVSAAISKMAFSGTGVSVSGLTAPMTLAGGQTANFTVTYKPVSAGTLTAATVSITSNASDPSLVIDLSGTATTSAVADLTASPASIAFGNVAVGSTATQTVKLSNSGTASAAISKMAFSGTGVSVSGLTAPLTLAGGQTANFTVTYKPTSAAKLTAATVSITSNASDPSLVIDLSGTATTSAVADLTASPASIAFGNVAVGSTATQTVKLSNTGTASAAISKMAFSGTGVSVSGLTAPLTLAGGQTASFTVTYKPTSAATLTGTVSITSNASDPTVQIGLSAIATSSTLAATPSSVSFGNVVVGSNSTQTVRMQNIGTSQVTISSITPSGAGVSVSGVTTPLNLAPGTSASFTAAYKPTAAGSVSGKITVASNAVGSPTVIDLSATAAAATIQLTPSATSLSFGNVTVGSSGTTQVTVKSTGNQNASISNVSVSGTGFTLGSSAASLVLDPSQSESYTVNFNPKAAGGASGTLTITSNAQNSPMKVALAGTAVAAPTSTHSVSLNWDRSSTSSVMGYFVYRSSKPSGPYAQLNTTPETSPSFSDSTVANGQVYYYVVTAVDSSEIQSTYSNQVSVTIPSN